VTTLLLDTHVVHWWSAEPQRVSEAAREALEQADELAVAAITWYELAWLAQCADTRTRAASSSGRRAPRARDDSADQ